MNITLSLPRRTLLMAVSLSLSACDSAKLTGTGEPIAAAALELSSDNLLSNGGFESQINGDNWRSCSSISDFSTDATPSEAGSALSVSNGTCFSQTTAAIPGATYTLSCDALTLNSGYSSITVGFLDGSSAPIEMQENAITSTDYTTIISTITAPASTVSADVVIYSEGQAFIDNCSLTRLPDPELINGDFSADLTGWQVCETQVGEVEVISSSLEAGNKQLTLSNGGCVYQTIDVSDTLEGRSEILNINLTCDTLTDGNGYASISLGYRDANFDQISINVENVISGSADGVFESQLQVPFDAQFAEVMIFSTSLTTVDSCSLSL